MFQRLPNLTIPFVLALSLALGASGSASAAPVIIAGDPVAPLPAEQGTGLCGARGLSTDPEGDFYVPSAQSGDFIEKMTTFFDAGEIELVSFAVSTPIDFSNNYEAANAWSFGDFLDAVPGCPAGGCEFDANESDVSFGMRLRGYLAVPPEHVEKPVHFGLFGDDAVALVLYDAAGAAYPVLEQSPRLGLPAWRMTNTVTFAREGLYPVEILYAGIVEHSALELSLLVGDFEDFQRAAAETGSTSLAESGFTLVAPTSLYRTADGGASPSDEDACGQCSREHTGHAGEAAGCDPGSYCNSAALCAPCAVDAACGPSCRACGGDTPRCALVEGTPACVACASDVDCDAGEVCDPEAHACAAAPAEPGAGGGGGAGGDATPDPGPADPGDGGCVVHAGTPGQRNGWIALALAGLGIALARRRPRTSAPSGTPAERASR